MKEALVNGQGAILARDESAKVAQPRDAAFDDPAPPVACSVSIRVRPGSPSVNGSNAAGRSGPCRATATVRAARRGRSPCRQSPARASVAVVHHGGAARRGSSAAFLPPAGLPTGKPSQVGLPKAHRSRRQQVAGDGNSSGKSCHRAPRRSIHKIPSSTLRSFAVGRPPRGRGGRWGNKGRIFSHGASASNRPYRVIGPPSGAASFGHPPPQENNYSKFNPWSRVLSLGSKQLLLEWRYAPPPSMLAVDFSPDGRIARGYRPSNAIFKLLLRFDGLRLLHRRPLSDAL